MIGVVFQLFEADRKTPAGKISLKWSGVSKDLLDSQQFKISGFGCGSAGPDNDGAEV